MKKTIIAAGASLAFAAMPVAGVLAVDVTDNLTINLSETCSITRTGVAASAVSNTSSDLDFGTTAANTYTATLVAGKAATIGTSTFTVTCNDTNNGHSLAVQFTGLSATVGSSSENIPYDGSAATADGYSRWNATKTANATLGVTSGLITATETTTEPHSYIYNGSVYGNNKTAVSGQTFTIEYNVSTAITQPAATYTGSAAYTLTYGAQFKKVSKNKQEQTENPPEMGDF